MFKSILYDYFKIIIAKLSFINVHRIVLLCLYISVFEDLGTKKYFDFWS